MYCPHVVGAMPKMIFWIGECTMRANLLAIIYFIAWLIGVILITVGLMVTVDLLIRVAIMAIGIVIVIVIIRLISRHDKKLQ